MLTRHKTRSEFEIRFANFELRERTPEQAGHLVGYAAVFNRDAEFQDWRMTERIAPGAFAKTIKDGDVRMLWNHNTDFVLGRTTSNTLALAEDKEGLSFDGTPPDTQLVRDMVLTPIERGDVSQMSFGFRVVKEQWMYDEEKDWLTRTLLELRLYEISPVTFPAYAETEVSLRSLAGVKRDEFRAAAARETEPGAVHSEETPASTSTVSVSAFELEAARLALEIQAAEFRLRR